MKLVSVEMRGGPRVCQGDVLRDVEYLESAREENGEIAVDKIVFPLSIVLTQDCDLEHHAGSSSPGARNQDKLLVSVLLAPMYNRDLLLKGEHLARLERATEVISGDLKRALLGNQRLRYHSLSFPGETGLPDVVIDFKHYFSQSVDYLIAARARNYVCSLGPHFREDLAQRFAAFLSRVAIPDKAEAATTGVARDADMA